MRNKHLFVCIALCLLALTLAACTSTSAQSDPAVLLQQTWYVDAARFGQGAHASLQCADCHSDISMKDVPDKHPDNTRVTQDAVAIFDYSACEHCHPQEYAAYQTGIHAEVLAGKRENKTQFEAPVCGNCHSPHYDPANRTRTEIIAVQVETCGACHPSERETYLQNYHGKAAANLADTQSAACTDCHGGHNVVSLAKTENALAACQGCHPTANTNMAAFRIHAADTLPTPETTRADESIALFAAKVFFTLLIVGILGFFYAHTLLWLIRSAHQKMRGG